MSSQSSWKSVRQSIMPRTTRVFAQARFAFLIRVAHLNAQFNSTKRIENCKPSKHNAGWPLPPPGWHDDETRLHQPCTSVRTNCFSRLKPDTYSIRGSSSISSAPFKVVAAGHVGFHPIALPTELPSRNFWLLWDYDFSVQPDLMREQVHAVCADAA